MANEYTFGQKLQGIGAALSGTVPQFQQEMQQLDDRRVEAMYKDAGAAYQMYGQNNLGGIIDLANDRLRILQRLPGSDPSDTMQVLQLSQAAQSGDKNAYTQLGGILKQAYDTGISLNILKPPAAPAEYTLGPEDVRIRDGVEIARGIGKATAQILSDDAVTRLGLDANKIWQRSSTGQITEVGGSDPTSQKPSARQEKIQDFMDTFGFTRKEAIDAIETQRFVNPLTGNVMTYSPVTSEVQALDAEIPVTETPRGSIPGITPEMLSFNVTKGTGFVSSFSDILDRTIGQTGMYSSSPLVREAGQKMQLLTRDAIKALASSSRPPVIEQQMIMDIVPQPYQWMENPETAEYQTITFLDLLGQQFLDDKRYAQNPNNPKAERESSQRRQREIQRVMYSVLTPEAAETIFSNIDALEQEVGDILNMPIDQLKGIDVSTLSDAQLDVYIERLRDASNNNG